MSATSQPVGAILSTASAEPATSPPSGQLLLEPAVQAILQQARQRQQRDVEARQARQQEQARWERAYEAWRQVVVYHENASPYGWMPAEQRGGYVQRIVTLGSVLASDSWYARLDAVTTDGEAKTYAVTLLRQAIDGNHAAIQTMVQEAIEHLGDFGWQADRWLREGLRYEVLGLTKKPTPPVGWEGVYGKAIETVADLVRWIDDEFLLWAAFDRVPRDQPSNGERVRNAFRLVTLLGLTGLPAEPLGPRTLNDELTVLRNLRRHCLPLIVVADRGGVSDATSVLDTNSQEEAAAKSVAAKTADGETAEQRVQRCLQDDAKATLEDVTSATGLSAGKICRTQAWKDHQERQLDAYLHQHPEADSGDVQDAFGLSRSKVVTTRAWKAHQTRRDAAHSRRRVENRERPLTKAMEDCHADESVVDPSVRIDQREQIFRAVLEQAAPFLRADLHGLVSAEREALVDHLLHRMDDGGVEGREPSSTLAILVEVAQSWWEERQQQKRRGQRRHRRDNVR